MDYFKELSHGNYSIILSNLLLDKAIKLEEKLEIYEKIIEIKKQQNDQIYKLTLNQLVLALQEKNEIGKYEKYLSEIDPSIIKYKLLLKNFIKNGKLEKIEQTKIDLYEYLRQKKLYHIIQNDEDDNNSIKTKIIKLLISVYILDIDQVVLNFQKLRKILVIKNIREEIYFELINEIYKKMEVYRDINANLDIIINQLYLNKRLYEIKKGSLLKDADYEIFKEVLLIDETITNLILITKILSQAEKKNLSFEFLRYLEKKKDFDYFEFVNKDLELKNIFIEFRKYQTGIIKVPQKTNDFTREFQFEKPSNSTEYLIQKSSISEILKDLNPFNKSEEDLMVQLKLGAFDKINDKENLAVCFQMLGFVKLVEGTILKYQKNISQYFKCNFYFEEKRYYEVINYAEEVLHDKKINEELFKIFSYFKALSLYKLKKMKESKEIFRQIISLDREFRDAELYLNEIKNA